MERKSTSRFWRIAEEKRLIVDRKDGDSLNSATSKHSFRLHVVSIAKSFKTPKSIEAGEAVFLIRAARMMLSIGTILSARSTMTR